MSPVVAAQLEKQLEDKGSLSLTRSQIEGFFDCRARKLVRMSGRAALSRIRAGKAGSGSAWTELTLLAGLIR